MSATLNGLHHVTSITADPQKNVDFYAGILGLRLVKLTVNFDDPQSYHLYYGDELGRPGSIMTFFAWPGAERGRIGWPQATSTAFSIPAGSVRYWQARLREHQIKVSDAQQVLGDEVITFEDFDGLPLAIVAPAIADLRQPWARSDVPVEHAIRGFHNVTLTVSKPQLTMALLTGELGFKAAGESDERLRFASGSAIPGTFIDVLRRPVGPSGRMGAGVVHHIALRTPDDPQQAEWREQISSRNPSVSPVMDRTYFHSIYFREPSGVLFEIATENPGFAVDEPAEKLGTTLRLPPWIEPARDQLLRVLPPLKLPAVK
jgi:glyoxalase family protein